MNQHLHHHGHTAGEQTPATSAAVPMEAPAGTIYTCPMHPEVQQDHPGNCPKCGMSLEAVIPLDEEDNSELIDFQHRFWWTRTHLKKTGRILKSHMSRKKLN